jgi:hypothetical protein
VVGLRVCAVGAACLVGVGFRDGSWGGAGERGKARGVKVPEWDGMQYQTRKVRMKRGC